MFSLSVFSVAISIVKIETSKDIVFVIVVFGRGIGFHSMTSHLEIAQLITSRRIIAFSRG
jgi:hypothetical protein